MSWHPTATRAALKARAGMNEHVRHFFSQRKVLEVDTPVLGLAAAADHGVQVLLADNGYLQSSPVSFMLRLLAAGSGDIFQIAHAFRKVPLQSQDNVEFSLLQWFRQDHDHWDMMEEMADLLELLLGCQHVEHVSYQSVFGQYLGLNPLDASLEQLKFEARQHLNVEMPRAGKDDWLQLLMEYFIEPSLGAEAPVFVYDYPASAAGLASLGHDEKGAEVAECFRLYYRGMALGGGFRMLSETSAFRQRLLAQNELRQQKGMKPVPIDGDLLQAAVHGFPACAGATLGLDRVLMQQLRAGHIQDVMSFIRPA